MNYQLLQDVVQLVADFEAANANGRYENSRAGFERWLYQELKSGDPPRTEPDWEGKESGRSAESVISTLLLQLNRFAKRYSKAAMQGSDFSTQEEFIYLINLKAFGPLAKMELIKKNVQEKPAGMQVINRLIGQGWAQQTVSKTDKRSRVVKITPSGLRALEKQMTAIRKATQIVSGNLSANEKLELIRLLTKLHQFHETVFQEPVNSAVLLDTVLEHHFPAQKKLE